MPKRTSRNVFSQNISKPKSPKGTNRLFANTGKKTNIFGHSLPFGKAKALTRGSLNIRRRG